MAMRLKIKLKRETSFVILASRPVGRWCDTCEAESSFVDEEAAQASAAELLPEIAANIHRAMIDGRSYICLRSISS